MVLSADTITDIGGKAVVTLLIGAALARANVIAFINLALRRSPTMEKFLDWEQTQSPLSESPIVTTTETQARDALQVNLLTELNTRLRYGMCRVHGDSFKIRFMGRIRRPAALVTSKPPAGKIDPIFVFEVVRNGDAPPDSVKTAREFAEAGSIQRYFMIEQTAVEAVMFARTGAGTWRREVLGQNAALVMPEAGIELPLAAIYRGIELDRQKLPSAADRVNAS